MTTGGSAMNLGANFQADIAAFFAIVSLADHAASVPRSVATPGALGVPVRIGTELDWPTDDVAVWFDHALWFAQVKASLDASESSTSDYAGVIDQFVRQWRHGRANEQGVAFTPDDRLVLVLGEGASRTLRVDLRDLLERIPDLAADEPLATSVRGQLRFREALDRISAHVRHSLEQLGLVPDESNVRAVLRHARVWATSRETLQHVGRTLLGAQVLQDATQSDVALATLQRHFADAAQRRTTHDRRSLYALLRNAGVALKEPPSISADVGRLVDHTKATVQAERRTLRTREGRFHITRAIVPAVVEAARRGNLVVTGQAGAGKSDVILQTADALLDAGARVVFLDAANPRMADPGGALGLDKPLETVLERWADDGTVGYLLIDGFDSTRIGASLEVLLSVVKRAGPNGWHVVVASREYDLLHAGMLEDIFPPEAAQSIPNIHRDERFGRLAHVNVRRLTRAEIAEITSASPPLAAIIAAANERLAGLLTNPFNLSIAASFTVEGEIPDLTLVRSQIELLDVWWNRRVLVGAQSSTKERVVRDAASAMIQERKLRLPKVEYPEGASAEELFSVSVFASTGRREEDFAFTHAIVFDYAVDRLIFAREGAIANLLAQDRDAFLFVLPSLRMRFDSLWTYDRARFYRELRVIFESTSQRSTLLMIIARVIYERFETITDLEPLLNDAGDRADAAIRFLIRTLIYDREHGHPIADHERTKWADLALELTRRFPRFEHDALLLTIELLEHAA